MSVIPNSTHQLKFEFIFLLFFYNIRRKKIDVFREPSCGVVSNQFWAVGLRQVRGCRCSDFRTGLFFNLPMVATLARDAFQLKFKPEKIKN